MRMLIFAMVLAWCALWPARITLGEEAALASPPALRIEAQGFSASEADIRAVLESVREELWRNFPDDPSEPILVVRGNLQPITLFQRSERGEIVVKLNTSGSYWCQYAYQFAHELCHVACKSRQQARGNLWFEETLCETSSLYVMRAMSRSWGKSPPYPNWRDYHDALRDYADAVIRRRKMEEIYAGGMGAFYLAHQAELEKVPVSRELNGEMAVVLLHLFEEDPGRWEAVRWLNATTAVEGDTFAVYLQHWRDAAPPRHKAFVEKVAAIYGITLKR